jgi:hypothetical protein
MAVLEPERVVRADGQAVVTERVARIELAAAAVDDVARIRNVPLGCGQIRPSRMA